MTKRFLIGAAVLAAALLVLGLNLGSSGTASATEPTPTPAAVVDTHAQVNETGIAPIINAKWELPDMQSNVAGIQYEADPSTDLNDNDIPDADDDPLTSGMQMYPNLCDEPEPRQIEYWIAAEDEDGAEDIQVAWVDVKHPDGTFKYQVDLEEVECSEIGYFSDNPPALNVYAPLLAAIDTDQMTRAEAEDIVTRCYKDEKRVFKGGVWVDDEEQVWPANIHHHQPAGMYEVSGSVQDEGAAMTTVVNHFEVLPIVGLRIDFSVVDWGPIKPLTVDWVSGDGDLGTPAKPTVKNCGNVLMALGLHFSEMEKVGDSSKVITEFDAKFMDDQREFVASVPQWFSPSSCAPPCTPKELDLSIHPPAKLPPGVYEGTLDIYAAICGE